MLYFNKQTLQYRMKKKITISVKQLAKKNKPQSAEQNEKNPLPQILSQPKSFEQMYQYVVQNKKKLHNKKHGTVIFDSKKTTPSNSRYIKNSCENKNTRSNPNIDESFRTWEAGSNRTFETTNKKQSEEFDKILEKLNHQDHSHIRGYQCFLKEEQIKTIMKQLNYDQNEEVQPYFDDLLEHLEAETYGGIPSENLKLFLQIIDGTWFQQPPTREESGKIRQILPQRLINSNLKLEVSKEDAISIYFYYEPLRTSKLKDKSLINKKLSIEDIYKKVEQLKQQQVLKENINYGNKVHEENVQPMKKFGFRNEEKQGNYALAKPLLSVDVNLGEGVTQKIIVYEGESSKQVSQRLKSKFTLTQETVVRFEKMLENHLSKMLWKIDQVNQELISERQ